MEATSVANQEEKDLIVSYLRKDPGRYRIAKAVGEAWPDLVGQVAPEFPKDVEERLRRVFGDAWKVESEKKVRERYFAFQVSKPEWGDHYHLQTQFQWA